MQISTTRNYLEDWQYDYENNERLLRYHQGILDGIKEANRCRHGEGENRAFPQGGCYECFSRVVVTNCTVLAARLSARREAVA